MNKKLITPLICGLAILGLGLGWLGGGNYLAAKGNDEDAVLHVSTAIANLNFETMIDHADLIISGVVTEVTDFKIANQGTYKKRHASVDVTESFKGGIYEGETVLVEMTSYEGISGINFEDRPASPNFAVDDNVILFLVANDHGSYYIAAINQGAFFIDETAKTSDTVYKHKQHIGNDLERFTRSELLAEISGN